MAVTLIEQKETKRSRTLFVVLGFLIVMSAAFLGRDFLKKLVPGAISDRAAVSVFRTPEIDFATLQSEALKDLEPFEGIKPFEGEAGRENPFIPY